MGQSLTGDPEGNGSVLPISHHPDQLAEVTRGYGAANRPEDFLDNFTNFVRNNVNKIAALAVVVQRPRELTRAQLRELRLELDRQGFSDSRPCEPPGSNRRMKTLPPRSSASFARPPLAMPLVPFEERVREAIRTHRAAVEHGLSRSGPGCAVLANSLSESWWSTVRRSTRNPSAPMAASHA